MGETLSYWVPADADADAGLKSCAGSRSDIDVIVFDVVLLSTRIESTNTPLIHKPLEQNALAGLIRRRINGGSA